MAKYFLITYTDHRENDELGNNLKHTLICKADNKKSALQIIKKNIIDPENDYIKRSCADYGYRYNTLKYKYEDFKITALEDVLNDKEIIEIE